MKLSCSPRRRRAGYTRREWLIGSVVVLALLATTARELRHAPPPTCGPACSPCGGDAATGLDRWAAAQTNVARPPADDRAAR